MRLDSLSSLGKTVMRVQVKEKVKHRLTVGSRWRNHHTQDIFVVQKIRGLSVIAKNELTSKTEKIHRSNISINFELLE